MGRILVLDLTIGDLRCSLANIYAPNEDNPDFFNEIINKIHEFNNECIIIFGDFNLVMDVDKDKQGGRATTHFKCLKQLTIIMEEEELVDCWRREHPNVFGYTWRSYHAPYVYCRLDFFLVSFSLLSSISKNIIHSRYRSDHYAVSIEIKTDVNKKGPGFWKLNCQLLENETYIEIIKKCINDCIVENQGTEDSLLWETIKCRIRGASVKFSAGSKRSKNEEIKILKDDLNKLKCNMPTLLNPEDCALEINKLESM